MPPCLVLPVAVVRRREAAQGRTWYAREVQERHPVALVPSSVPDAPRYGDVPTRPAMMTNVFYFAPQSPAGALEFVKVTADGKVHIEGDSLLAEMPRGYEQAPWQDGTTGRGNVLRRPVQPFGNRSGVNVLI